MEGIKISIRLFFIAFFVFFSSNEANATHAMAVDITYKCVGPNQYAFCVNFYRDCEGIPPPGSVNLNFSSQSCGQNFTVNIDSTVTGLEVSQLCPDTLPYSTCNSSGLPGVELTIYCDTITLPANCSDWVVSFSISTRNDNVVNLVDPDTEALYVEVTLDNTNNICNNSVDYSSSPVVYTCDSADLCFNHGAYDIDGDSLYFTLVPPKGSGGVPISWTPGYSLTNPIITYSGFNFDPITGQMCWTAMGQQICVISMMVEEWREINGVWTLIATSIREMQVIVMGCDISQPFLTGGIQNLQGGSLADSVTINICPGDTVSYDLIFDDDDPDAILNVTSNADLVAPGSILDTNGTNPVNATFTWYVPSSYQGQNVITFKVENDVCPIPGQNFYAFNIYVLEGTSGGPDLFHCPGGIPVQMNAEGGNVFVWTPPDSLSCDTCSQPFAFPDTTTEYIVTSDLAGVCGNTDTVMVYVVPAYNMSAGLPDTICKNDTLMLIGSTNIVDSGMTYSWLPNYNIIDDDSIIAKAYPDSTIDYILNTISSEQCKMSDTVNINVAGTRHFITAYASDDSICVGETVNLVVSASPTSCGANTTGCSSGQQEITVGSAGSAINNGTPYQGFYEDGRVQYLILQSELAALGLTKGTTFKSLSFYVSLKNSNANYNNFTIKMGCTSLSSISTFQPGLTQVYNASVSNSIGWNDYQFSSYYDWDGTSNLLIEVCFDNNNWTGSDFVFGTATSFNSVVYDQDDFSSGCSLNFPSISSQRPNMKFSICSNDIDSTFDIQWFPHTYIDNDTIPSPISSPLADISYYVTITEGLICSSEDSLTIAVRPEMVTTLSMDTVMCYGETYSMAATGGYYYNWTPASGLSDANIADPAATPSTTTKYYVQIEDSAYGCIVVDSLTININQLPIPNFSVDTVCQEAFSVFADNSQGTSGNIIEWQWDFGDGNSFIGQNSNNVNHLYSSSGSYSVNLKVIDDNGCENSYSMQANVWNKPTADFVVDPSTMQLLINAQMDITDASLGALSWLYYFGQLGQGDFSSDQNPSYIFEDRGVYPVYQIITNSDGCKDTIYYDIDVIEDPHLDVPTAFSPNSDGINDILNAKALGVNLHNSVNSYIFKIFNRWGKLIFETNNIDLGWDGTYKGNEQPVGTYVYYLEAITPEETVFKKGNISLLR